MLTPASAMRFLHTKLIVPAYDLYSQNQTRRYRKEVKRVFASTKEEIRLFQLQRLRVICQLAYNNTEYYRQLFNSIGLRSFSKMTFSDFSEIPVLPKSVIREEVGRLVSQQFQAKDLHESATGGTTASPVRIFMDWPCYFRRWAVTEESDRSIGYSRGEKIAYLWGASQDMNSTPTWKRRLLERYVFRRRFYPSGILDDEILTRYFNDMSAWRPDYLQAYPTPLYFGFEQKCFVRIKVETVQSLGCETYCRAVVVNFN